MGVASSVKDILTAAERTVRDYFEPQLTAMGLGAGSIRNQDLPELETSLIKINDAIEHADSFDKVRLRFTTSGAIVANSDSNWTVERGILPVLLDRKALIIDRIKSLRPEQQLNEIRNDVANKVTDPVARDELIKLIDNRFKEERASQEKLDREQAQVQVAQVEVLEREKRLQIEIYERRWAIYRSFLERESMASIVGSLLLMALASVLIIAMFTHTAAPEIVTSAFLLILGYFFGQTTARGKSSDGDK